MRSTELSLKTGCVVTYPGIPKLLQKLEKNAGETNRLIIIAVMPQRRALF
jgi:hypothetical protein